MEKIKTTSAMDFIGDMKTNSAMQNSYLVTFANVTKYTKWTLKNIFLFFYKIENKGHKMIKWAIF